ncbi:MAG: phosphatase PAP2 family protein [Bacteroidia bacterium]|nr:phosphatase PAP2 family protein [Bacteroidia bacterium]
MGNTVVQKTKAGLLFSEFINSMMLVLKSKYFYIGFFTLVTGLSLNVVSQVYLNNNLIKGVVFPPLSDLILDEVPVIDVAILYDLFCIVIFSFVAIYIVHKKEYGRMPYFFLLCGIFYIIRALFVVLTPLGNPSDFNGSDPFFKGFCKYELGVFPSGHVGNSFLLLLLVNDKIYRYILAACLAVIIVALILSHCHYSIDILAGFLFAYAIKSFGDKYLQMFVLKDKDPAVQ